MVSTIKVTDLQHPSAVSPNITLDAGGGATFNATIVGSGAGITGLNGSNITTGTIAAARLDPAVMPAYIKAVALTNLNNLFGVI